MNAQLDMDWSAGNQQLLSAEFARLRALLGEGDLARARAEIDSNLLQMPSASAIDTLTHLFGLSGFERDLLLLVAAVELDSRVASLCAEACAQPQRPWASFGLALAVLPEPYWSALAPIEALRRWRLINVDETAGLTAGRLNLDERVLHFICGLNYLDHRLQAQFQQLPGAGLMADAHREIAHRASEQLRAHSSRWPLVLLSGNDCQGQRDIGVTLAQALGVSLFQLRAADIPAAAHEQHALATLWQREATLLGAGLMICQDGENETKLPEFVERINGLVVVSGKTAARFDLRKLQYKVDKMDAPGQRRLWLSALGDKSQPLREAVDGIASQYSLDARRIARCCEKVEGRDNEHDIAVLHELCRSDGSSMGQLAELVQPRAHWQDLILPPGQLGILHQLALHTRHRITVHHDWGFADKCSRGLGIATLFSGESGTGKTLAAEVLANTLGIALYRIDLSAVVSKYIGETEKNLRKLFDAAEDLGAILLFDEADALFGKRSDVKDSHDRYANIEVSYLLQRMESYRGLAILTTNHESALDTAFQRRLRFVVHFPFPDAVQREAIWRNVFPPGTPLDELDYARLARLNVAGGNIRNIAMSAAFLAADAGLPVTMAQLRRAAQLEAAKAGKTPSEAETRGWT
jgi:predicted nucleic acid-binding protein